VLQPFSIESTEKSLIFLNSVVIVKCKWMETYLGGHGLAYLPLQKRPQEKYHTCGFPLGKKYRSHFEIIALIVEAVKDSGQAKFSIMKHSNINCGQLNKFLFSLVEMGFVEQYVANGRPMYRASTRGQSFLRQYYVLLSMLMASEREVKRFPMIYEAQVKHM
jgi:predicted transcriptional regulator